MGYSTKFEGRFNFNKPAPLVVLESIKDLEGLDTRDRSGVNYPGYYCQWVLTKDNAGIKWDGEEKFEKWEEWLNWLIRNFLLPNDIRLSGRVTFQGEDIDDAGYIDVLDGDRVVVTKVPTISDELKDLREFRDFVLVSEHADELLELWKKKTGRPSPIGTI